MIPDASVNCTMEENVNNIKAGDTILIKGICSGYINGDIDMGLPGDVFLIRCYYFNLKNNMKRIIVVLAIVLTGISSISFARFILQKTEEYLSIQKRRWKISQPIITR